MVLDAGVVVENLLLPIGAFPEGRRVGERCLLAVVHRLFVHQRGVLGGVQQIQFFGGSLTAVVAAIVDPNAACRTFFCRDQNNTGGSTRSVNGRRSGVFQDFDGFYVTGIQVVDTTRTHHDAIHHVERITGPFVQRSRAPNPDRSRRTGCS